jgi:hypothetical protein
MYVGSDTNPLSSDDNGTSNRINRGPHHNENFDAPALLHAATEDAAASVQFNNSKLSQSCPLLLGGRPCLIARKKDSETIYEKDKNIAHE